MTETNIFTQYMQKRNVIVKNKKILQSSYIPENLPHRMDKIREIVEIIAPSLNKDKPSNILIFGKTGTGKTAVMNFVGKELKKADEEQQNCSFIYVNCEVVDTTYGILYNISNQIITDPSKRIPFTGWSLDKILAELTDYIDKQDKVFIIVLDEIDRSFQKNGDDIFYYLTTINEVLQNSKVSIIGITNNVNFTELLGQRVKSRLGEEKIIFPPYNVEQLQDILEARARDAFDEGVLDDDVIPYCAALLRRSLRSGDGRCEKGLGSPEDGRGFRGEDRRHQGHRCACPLREEQDRVGCSLGDSQDPHDPIQDRPHEHHQEHGERHDDHDNR